MPSLAKRVAREKPVSNCNITLDCVTGVLWNFDKTPVVASNVILQFSTLFGDATLFAKEGFGTRFLRCIQEN
ncbi:MAG: hypothetical protein FWD71_11470 [Oscillospiraceae bacterium]|nr:hypothetical protein [Oscillospiraceae bacterium]